MSKEAGSKEMGVERGVKQHRSIVDRLLRRAMTPVTQNEEIRYSAPFYSDARIITIKDKHGAEQSFIGRKSDLTKLCGQSKSEEVRRVRLSYLRNIATSADVIDSSGKVVGKVKIDIVGDKLRILEGDRAGDK